MPRGTAPGDSGGPGGRGRGGEPGTDPGHSGGEGRGQDRDRQDRARQTRAAEQASVLDAFGYEAPRRMARDKPPAPISVFDSDAISRLPGLQEGALGDADEGGSVAGAIVGGIVGFFTGGPVGAVGGAKAGSKLGSMMTGMRETVSEFGADVMEGQAAIGDAFAKAGQLTGLEVGPAAPGPETRGEGRPAAQPAGPATPVQAERTPEQEIESVVGQASAPEPEQTLRSASAPPDAHLLWLQRMRADIRDSSQRLARI